MCFRACILLHIFWHNKTDKEILPESSTASGRIFILPFDLPDGMAIVEDGLHDISVVPVIAFAGGNHLHKPQRKLTSHLEALLHGAGNILLPISFFGIIKTDQRIIFGYSLPHFLQGFHDQPIDDVVTADDSGAFRDALQKSFNGTDIAFVVGFVRNTPLDIIIVQFQTTISHRFRHALKLFYALVVVVHKDACNVAVSGIHQASYQLMGTFDVIDRYAGAAQVPIEVVVEYHRDLTSVKLLVAVKIWAEDARFDTIHDETVKILMYHSLQTTAFVAEFVIGQKYMEVNLLLRQNTANPFD